MYYCGIDIANKSSAICVLDESDKIIWEGSCLTDRDGFIRGLERWGSLHCVIEASPLSEWLAEVLEELGHKVTVIDPRKAKSIITSKRKTDKLDARNLARMCRTGWYSEVHRKSADARLLRSYLKARKGLVDDQRGLSNRIRGLLRAHGIKVGVVSNGRFVEHVRDLVGCYEPGLSLVIEPLLQLWVHTRLLLKEVTKELTRLAKRDACCQRLMSVPGVGPLVSSAYVATIDDPTRFSRGDQVCAYLGLVPSIVQSGEMEYRGRITKEGDGLLRWLLVEAAHVLLTRVRSTSELRRWGLKLAKRKGMSKAKVAVARKLAKLLHHLWVTNQEFDPMGALATS